MIVIHNCNCNYCGSSTSCRHTSRKQQTSNIKHQITNSNSTHSLIRFRKHHDEEIALQFRRASMEKAQKCRRFWLDIGIVDHETTHL